MLIYVFTEVYPSPYKPYFDTQFEQFLKDGHSLKIFSSRAQGDNISNKVRLHSLDKHTSHTPSTLRTLPKHSISILTNLLQSPLERIRLITRIYDKELSMKDNFLRIMRMMTLPCEMPDLCLVHNLTTAIQFTFLRNMYHPCPTAFYYHGGEVAGFPEIGINESTRGFSAFDYIFTNTESSKSHAISRGCGAEKITVCPVGFNLTEFDVEKIKDYREDNVLRLITIGRMSEEKGHIFALKALHSLITAGYTNIHYKLIGDGPLQNALSNYVQEHGIEEYVEFIGHVPRDVLYEELKNSDVHLLPSVVLGTWQENQACVVQEAMLFKTLVISSAAGGVPESTAPVMRHYCFVPENVQQIVEIILELLAAKDDELRELGEQCRAFTIGNYNIETLNQRILSTCTS